MNINVLAGSMES
ncbi:Protein of unknown function [Bacillus mobilis]|nr:Protein of unknown function [Bacillus mobilis]